MLEVLFGESEAAAMKVAKSKKAFCAWNDGPTAVFGDADVFTKHTGTWKTVPGDASEVFCLTYMLDVGDIRVGFDSAERKELMLRMYTQSGWDNSQEYLTGLRGDIQCGFDEYYRLLKAVEKDNNVRIWYSKVPYSLCGLYWFCNSLMSTDINLSVVELPEFREEDNILTSYVSWGELSAEYFAEFLCYERELSVIQRRYYAHEWSELADDGSRLRAVVNGRLTSVTESFYDFLIMQRLGTTPVKEARLIGDMLGRFRLGVGDWWYAYRIDRLIADGYIGIDEDSEQKYTRMIHRL